MQRYFKSRRFAGLGLPTAAGLALVAALVLLTGACAPAGATTAAASTGRAGGDGQSTAAGTAETGLAPAKGAPVLLAAAAGERAWYADRLEAQQFYVFPKPVDPGDFEAEALAAGATPAKLSAARGKLVLLNFWATWCPPCRAEMPSIDRLSGLMKDDNFTVMAVSVGEERKVVADFIAAQKYRLPVFLDRSGRLGAAFGARSIPTTYLFDKEGKVIAGIVGSREYDSPELVALLKEMAAK
ncbi:MAG: TlpA family protein disulfide reductase [Spirochaetaceae bacterium]|nr:TlpA family protein disulfide reductase [Spirochaetaceae bacterium]